MRPEGAFALANAPDRREFPATEEASSWLGDLASGPRYRGGVDGFRDGVLNGWAVDLSARDRALPIVLEVEGREIARFSTDQHRLDMAELSPGNVAGFTLDLATLSAQALADLERALAQAPAGKPLDARTLTLRLDGDGPHLDLGRDGITARKALAQCRVARGRNELSRQHESSAPTLAEEAGSPEPAPPPVDAANEIVRRPRYLAGVDGLFGVTLRGWAVDLLDPRASVALRLEAEGRAIVALATSEHRADIASVLEGNVAGFSLDFATLPAQAIEAIARALANAPPNEATPSRLVALVVEADNSLIDIGVSVGALRAGIDAAASPVPIVDQPPPPAQPQAPTQPAVAAPRLPRRSTRDARALNWLLAHVAGDLPNGDLLAGDLPNGDLHAGDLSAGVQLRPARRFADKLLADIERAKAVSWADKLHAAAIAPVFDPFHYLDRVAEPIEAIANPLLHYVLAGWRDGASPSPLFAPDFYRRGRGVINGDPLLDFAHEGGKLGVDPHPLFDVAYYRERHLAGNVEIDPLAHYLEIGGRLRLDPSPLFDSARFLEAYGLGPEVDAPLETFLADPEFHDAPVTPTFDAALYRYQIEVERGEKLDEPPLVHYLTRGFRDETLLPNLLFDPAYYRERNKLDFDGAALLHYLSRGEAQGLACHPLFSPAVYDQQRGPTGEGAGALAHALANPGAFRSDTRMDDPIDPRVFAFVRQLVAENGAEAFCHRVYRDANPDLADLDDAVIEAHFRDRGAIEQRLASLTSLMRICELRVRDLPLGFVLEDYVSIYPDLMAFRNRFSSAIYHWGRYGRQERRLVGKWLFRIADLEIDLPTASAPLRVLAQAERVELCILIHAFYPDLVPELVAFAQNFRDVSFDIFINLVDISWTSELEEQVRAICPGAFVMLSNDAGRDVGGFTRLLEHVDIARYDVFAFLHSKKSPHVAPEKGEYWRRGLLSAIAGNAETARECVRMFREDPLIGLIGSSDWRSQDMGKNGEQYERLLDLLGVQGENRDLDFVSGFMFLVRADVVARLFETLVRLDFEYGGDKDLDFHIDGQIAHGVERAVPALVRQMGYQVRYR